MGDRANIVMRFENNGKKSDIFFYGHWAGRDAPAAAQRALARKERWTDDQYLARLVWDSFCPESQHGKELGFGISPFIGDNSHDLTIVDIEAQRVIRASESMQEKNSWTFEQFIVLPESAFENW